MPRYFFNLRAKNEFIRDDDGIDLPNLEQVRWEAEQGARALLAELIKGGQELDHQAFEVTDERGALVLVYEFREAIRQI